MQDYMEGRIVCNEQGTNLLNAKLLYISFGNPRWMRFAITIGSPVDFSGNPKTINEDFHMKVEVGNSIYKRG